MLFRGHREGEIRANLVKRGLIKGIIGLPPNLFYGTGIPACIVVIDKEGAAERDSIFMIDASKGFVKDGNKNRLRAQDIHKIVDVFNRELEVARYSRRVPVEEIASEANNYNLNLARYIESSDPEDIQDLAAICAAGSRSATSTCSPILGGVPLSPHGAFVSDGRPGYCEPLIPSEQVRTVILAHGEFDSFSVLVAETVDAWVGEHRSRLYDFDRGALPRDVIDVISESLLGHFVDVPLLSEYEAYQRLLDYWDEVMQDDLYLIAADGWVERHVRAWPSRTRRKRSRKRRT